MATIENLLQDIEERLNVSDYETDQRRLIGTLKITIGQLLEVVREQQKQIDALNNAVVW